MQRLEKAPGRDAEHERADQRLQEEGRVVLRGSRGGDDLDLLSFLFLKCRRRRRADGASATDDAPSFLGGRESTRSRPGSSRSRTERHEKHSPHRGAREQPRRARFGRHDRCCLWSDAPSQKWPSASTGCEEEGFSALSALPASPPTGCAPEGRQWLAS